MDFLKTSVNLNIDADLIRDILLLKKKFGIVKKKYQMVKFLYQRCIEIIISIQGKIIYGRKSF